MNVTEVSNEIITLQWTLSHFDAWRIGLCDNLRSKRVNYIIGARDKFRSLYFEQLKLEPEDQIYVVKEFLYFCSEGNRVPIADRSILEDFAVQKKSEQIFNQWRQIGTIGQLIVEFSNTHAESELWKRGLTDSPNDVREAARGDAYLLQLNALINISHEVKVFLQDVG